VTIERSAEIEAVVRRFLASRIENDMEAMRSLHSGSEYLRLIGGDEWQWFQGAEAVLPTGGGSGPGEDDGGFGGNRGSEFQVVDSEILRLEAYEEGNVGWAAVEQKRTLVGGHQLLLRITFVFHLEFSVWKAIQIHFSVPVSDEAFLDVGLNRTLSDLLTSLPDGTDAAAEGAPVTTVTMLFTDVVDSTRLSQSVGDAAWASRIAGHFEREKSAVESAGGSVVKTLGDGGMYVFPSATSALQAAAEIQVVLAGAADDFSVRMGIHTGDVFRSQQDLLGVTVNKAARVAAAADGGQILVSSATADMVNPSDFTFGTPITAHLKGIEATQTLLPFIWR
jgi:adenylate cyclase